MSFLTRFFDSGMEKADEMAERRRKSYESYPIEGHMTCVAVHLSLLHRPTGA